MAKVVSFGLNRVSQPAHAAQSQHPAHAKAVSNAAAHLRDDLKGVPDQQATAQLGASHALPSQQAREQPAHVSKQCGVAQHAQAAEGNANASNNLVAHTLSTAQDQTAVLYASHSAPLLAALPPDPVDMLAAGQC